MRLTLCCVLCFLTLLRWARNSILLQMKGGHQIRQRLQLFTVAINFNKLECSWPSLNSALVLMGMTYGTQGLHTMGKLQALPRSRIGWSGPTLTNTLSYIERWLILSAKKFYSVGPSSFPTLIKLSFRYRCHETFFLPYRWRSSLNKVPRFNTAKFFVWSNTYA